MFIATRRFHFDAAHKLPNYPSEKGNCGRLHGHRFTLEVAVQPKEFLGLNSEGMVIDFGDLKEVVSTYALSILDHTYLNDFHSNPTAENMVKDIGLLLIEGLQIEHPDVELHHLVLYETPDSSVYWEP